MRIVEGLRQVKTATWWRLLTRVCAEHEKSWKSSLIALLITKKQAFESGLYKHIVQSDIKKSLSDYPSENMAVDHALEELMSTLGE